jgi:hypothetical protein
MIQQAPSWSSLEYGALGGEAPVWKMLHYGAKRVFAPLAVFGWVDNATDTLQVMADSEVAATAVELNVTITVLSWAGSVLSTTTM